MSLHSIEVRIYYEDTDCGGVVYYANYLRYFERGRTELLRDLGMELGQFMDQGLYFVVAKAEIEYHRPARYGELLKVETSVSEVGYASVVFRHTVLRDEEVIAIGSVTVATVDASFKPKKMPKSMRDLFGKEIVENKD